MATNNKWMLYQLSGKIRQAKFSRSKKFFNQPVFQSSVDGILLIDKGRNIRIINPSFHALYENTDPVVLVGKSVFDIVSPKYRETVLSMLEFYDVVKTPIQPIEIEIVNNHNKLVPVYIWIVPLENNPGALTQLCIRDISDWKVVQEYLIQTNLELGDAYRDTLEGWGRALELRDQETQGHTKRVTEATVQLASTIGLSVESIFNIRNGAMLHDIGKMAIPDSILLKPGPLDANEWRIMKMHPIYARDMLSEIKYLKPALTIPYLHHEKWDGTGYPEGISGENIPIEARIFTVIDVWDALLSDRPYRKAWPEDKVKQYIEDNKYIYFDPEIVDVFLKV